MNHPYSAFCGCNACEIEGHAKDNIADSAVPDEEYEETVARWDAKVASEEAATASLWDEPSF